jgi:hypothetical protein
VYTFATPKLQPLITKPEGKNLIQACLNASDAPGPGEYGGHAVRYCVPSGLVVRQLPLYIFIIFCDDIVGNGKL